MTERTSTPRFGQIQGHYTVLVAEVADFVPPARPLREGVRFVVGRPDDELLEQERALVSRFFPHGADGIIAGTLPGWRPDTPILGVAEDGTLVCGGYLFPTSEALPGDGNAEIRYAFTRPEWRQSGLLHHLVAVAVERVREWGLPRLTCSTDRAGLPEAVERWGARLVEVEPKRQPSPTRRLLRRLRRRLGGS